MYLNKGDFPAALTSLRNAAGLDPKNTAIKATLAEVLHQIGKTEEARTLVEECLAVTPDEAIAVDLLKRIEAAQTTPTEPPDTLAN